MATGFVSRWKGKVTASEFYVRGQPVFGKTAAQSLAVVSSSLGASTSAGTYITLLSSGSTTQYIVRIEPPNFPGDQRLFQVSTAGVGLGVILTASTDGSITFNGSSLSVMKSSGTTSQVVHMVAMSSVNWLISGQYPFSSRGLWSLSTSS